MKPLVRYLLVGGIVGVAGVTIAATAIGKRKKARAGGGVSMAAASIGDGGGKVAGDAGASTITDSISDAQVLATFPELDNLVDRIRGQVRSKVKQQWEWFYEAAVDVAEFRLNLYDDPAAMTLAAPRLMRQHLHGLIEATRVLRRAIREHYPESKYEFDELASEVQHLHDELSSNLMLDARYYAEKAARKGKGSRSIQLSYARMHEKFLAGLGTCTIKSASSVDEMSGVDGVDGVDGALPLPTAASYLARDVEMGLDPAACMEHVLWKLNLYNDSNNVNSCMKAKTGKEGWEAVKAVYEALDEKTLFFLGW